MVNDNMRSLWAQYVDELLGGYKKFIECEWGFISYTFPTWIDAVQVEELYIVPEQRKHGRGRELFDRVCEIGREQKKEFVIAQLEMNSVVVGESIKAHLAVGLVPVAAELGKILMRKKL